MPGDEIDGRLRNSFHYLGGGNLQTIWMNKKNMSQTDKLIQNMGDMFTQGNEKMQKSNYSSV